MTQFPNEKDPHPNWVYPGQQGAYPPPQDPPYAYTSRDGAPAPVPGQSSAYALPSQSQYPAPPPTGQSSVYALPSQSQYPAPPPPQGYFPPQGPPPDYGYAQSHPSEGRSVYDPKGPSHETVLSPPENLYDTSVPDAGPSSSSSSQDGRGGVMMSIASFFGNKGPPPMWQRQAPMQLPYGAFPPMCLISNGKDLSKGFPDLPPPCQMNPHPFATHDITEEDWKRFLTDVKKAGSLSGAQRIKSNVIPMVTGMSLVTGFIATFAIEKRMKSKNRGAAGDLVDHWNHYFFGPRRMEVVLCQGSERLSGKLGAAPVGDPEQARMASRLRRRSDEDDDDSDSESYDEDSHGHHGHNQSHGYNQGYSDKHTRRAGRRERREARRERRAERRARKARGEYQEPYQLFITAV